DTLNIKTQNTKFHSSILIMYYLKGITFALLACHVYMVPSFHSKGSGDQTQIQACVASPSLTDPTLWLFSKF
ncbi:hypothetical protein ACQP3L_36495, partial [Escherichia coli]